MNSNSGWEQLQEELEKQRQKKTEILARAEDYTKFIEVLHAALRQICIKIAQGHKMPPGVTASPSPDDTLDLLIACTERVELLVEQCRDYDTSNTSKIYQGIKYNENVEDAQSVLKPKKKPQQFCEPMIVNPRAMDDFDSTTDQEVLTRAMVKRQAKIILDRHAKQTQKGAQRSASKRSAK